MTELEGIIEEIIFANSENGYTVCVANIDGEPVTLVGIMPFLGEGESIKVSGEWQTHATFGKQLRVEYFEKKLPTNVSSILKYLSSGSIRGVGPVTAERIVARFGTESLDIIDSNPDWLTEIKGITPKRASEIHDAYAQQFGMRAVMMYFNNFFGPSVSARIYKRFGSGAIDIVEHNPYILCTEVQGISFDKADLIARSVGFDMTSRERLSAAVTHYLSIAAYNSGHSYVPLDMVGAEVSRLLMIDYDEVISAVSAMGRDGLLAIREFESGEVVFHPDFYRAEQYISKKLQLLMYGEIPFTLEGVDEQIEQLEKVYELSYDTEQKRAVMKAVTCGVTIVTGGPGTGKTTVIKAIADIFKALKYSFILAAPTGRAAKRMSEASGYEAKTIHRLLEVGFDEEHKPAYAKNDENPLGYKAIIIDEMSMVDSLLMEALLRAIKPGSYLILIGDVDQLPPVGAGNVLSDIIESGIFDVCRLTRIYRQAGESLIITNAHKINLGKSPILDIKDNDFFFVSRTRSSDIKTLLVDLASGRLQRKYQADKPDDIQVITPTRKGELGTRELNIALQQAQNPQDGHKREKKYGQILFRENDKVMQVKNNYDILWTKDGAEGAGVFNGDIGIIKEINAQQEYMIIDFDSRIAEYDFALLDELEHSFAVTVHKSQGSEYKIVVIPAFDFPLPLMTRNLLYTAVTRAREVVCIVGKKDCILKMISNDHKPVRFTALKEFLCEG